jgi:hypothetical protein
MINITRQDLEVFWQLWIECEVFLRYPCITTFFFEVVQLLPSQLVLVHVWKLSQPLLGLIDVYLLQFSVASVSHISKYHYESSFLFDFLLLIDIFDLYLLLWHVSAFRLTISVLHVQLCHPDSSYAILIPPSLCLVYICLIHVPVCAAKIVLLLYAK